MLENERLQLYALHTKQEYLSTSFTGERQDSHPCFLAGLPRSQAIKYTSFPHLRLASSTTTRQALEAPDLFFFTLNTFATCTMTVTFQSS